MSNGIYPDYVGPTAQYRLNSLYPDWVKGLADVILPPVEALLGGVKVLASPYGVDMVVSGVGTMVKGVTAAVTTVVYKRDVRAVKEEGVEVVDEEPGV